MNAEVLALLGTGMSNAELSRELGVGAPTVKSHVVASSVEVAPHLTRPGGDPCPRTGAVGSAEADYSSYPRTRSTNISCTRRSPVTSGWKEVAITEPCRTATIRPAASPAAAGTCARTSTARPNSLHPRRADEDSANGITDDALELQVGLERIDLPTESVAAHRHVDGAEMLGVRPGV